MHCWKNIENDSSVSSKNSFMIHQKNKTKQKSPNNHKTNTILRVYEQEVHCQPWFTQDIFHMADRLNKWLNKKYLYHLVKHISWKPLCPINLRPYF